MQFYPFGVTQGDAVLPRPTIGEGSSPQIFLNEDFVFYDNIIRRLYVSNNNACIHAYIHIHVYI